MRSYSKSWLKQLGFLRAGVYLRYIWLYLGRFFVGWSALDPFVCAFGEWNFLGSVKLSKLITFFCQVFLLDWTFQVNWVFSTVFRLGQIFYSYYVILIRFRFHNEAKDFLLHTTSLKILYCKKRKLWMNLINIETLKFAIMCSLIFEITHVCLSNQDE